MESAPENPWTADALLSLAQELAAMGTDLPEEGIRLARKVSLLIHLLEEIRQFTARNGCLAPPPEAATSSAEASPWSCVSELGLALEAVKRFLLLGRWKNDGGSSIEDSVKKNMEIQYQYVTWNLEKVLANMSYEYFLISDEVLEEVELVRTQLRRETDKNGNETLDMFEEIYEVFNYARAREIKGQFSFKFVVEKSEIARIVNHDLRDLVFVVAEIVGTSNYDAERMFLTMMERLEKSSHTDISKGVKAGKTSTNIESCKIEDKNRGSLVIPEDFQCPISLELMRDPVIVSTGQTYERSFIQRWIDCGNRTCPKTHQKLENLTLTTNYVLRSLILQWCETNRIEQPYRSTTRGIRNDRMFDDITGDASMINDLVSKLASGSVEEKRSATAEIRSLAKKSTDNRILIAESGAIPVLISLLQVDDKKLQEHAVTSLLNLSIYDHNKEVIMLAGAILPIIEVLRVGSMEARENAAAAIFSLSLVDENKITIGGMSGVIEALVELLMSGRPRGQKDAATALINLCIYPGNKPRAVRAGILSPLLQMLKDSSACGMVDEILTILSVLVSHQEGKEAISKANTIPLLIDLLRTGQPRNKENATAILLALCKKDNGNLACIARLGAVIPLTEVAKSGTERAKRKASSLLVHLEKLQIF